MRLAHDDVGDAAGARRSDRERTNRARARDEDALPRFDVALGEAVQRDGQRLGERRGSQRHARRHAPQRLVRDQCVLGEGPVGVHAHPRRVPTRAEGGAAGEAVLAGAAARARPADDVVANLPLGDGVAHRDDAPRVLVTLDGAGAAPPLQDKVDVAAADPAVAHLEEHVVGPDRRDGSLLDVDLLSAAVDGDPHRVGWRAHAPTPWRADRSAPCDQPTTACERNRVARVGVSGEGSVTRRAREVASWHTTW